MAIVNLKSEKRLKQVVTSGGGAENANTYGSGDLVYSTSDDTLKQSDATNWKDVPIHPITKLYITNNSDTHYVFNGPGFDATANSNTGDRNPTIYLVRGQKYQFENLLGAHPFRISSSDGGGAYSDGITNNNVSSGILEWNVMHDVPSTMYYYCTSHAAMKGEIKIVDASGGSSATNLSVTANGTSLTVESSTGDNVALPLADASNWGVMSDELFVKLNGIETSADVTDATNVNAAGAIMHTDLATKGQIVVGDGTGDATILGVGTNTYVLTADSAEASGVKWAQVPAAPIIMFATKTLSGNTAVHTELNSGSGGTLMVSDSSQNAAGSNAADGFMVNTASLNQTGTKARYEIISALAGKGFRFKADTTAIDSFGGQAQIAAATGNSDGISVSDSQKLVLLYTGSAWQYMVQSI
jgi:hypothetical protein